MVLVAIVSLFLGIVCGLWILFSPQVVALFAQLSPYVLDLLMFAVGISVGTNKLVFQKVGEYHLKILLIPFGVITGSILGGMIASSYPLGGGDGHRLRHGLVQLSGSAAHRPLLRPSGIAGFPRQLDAGDCLLCPHSTHRQTFKPLYRHRPGGRHQRGHHPAHADPPHQRGGGLALSVFNGVLCSAVVPIAIDLCWRLLPH